MAESSFAFWDLRHEPSVALPQFAKLSRAFLAVWAALLARRFCSYRAAVILHTFLAAELK
jgi:hypothetical protein